MAGELLWKEGRRLSSTAAVEDVKEKVSCSHPRGDTGSGRVDQSLDMNPGAVFLNPWSAMFSNLTGLLWPSRGFSSVFFQG